MCVTDKRRKFDIYRGVDIYAAPFRAVEWIKIRLRLLLYMEQPSISVTRMADMIPIK